MGICGVVDSCSSNAPITSRSGNANLEIFHRLKILGRTATWKEKLVLGGAKFFDDITITHCDSVYFQKHYETKFNPDLCARAGSKAQDDQVSFAKGEQQGADGEPSGFRPMYCMYFSGAFSFSLRAIL